ncbi:hypothetical protein F8M41_020633 [Gigaspora margarita]|uniref:Uncharacterized protein n=1 Tax=Gigaspora margarita TaxID=4874 RepID=A0A8H4AI14_GIGMA|nr:hypothetical protein F8M41_020633 [Gigaspora margarita]
MVQTKLAERLIKGSNIWNLAVIDNINFKASTIATGNIFDIGRKTSCAILRIVFQFILSTVFDNITNITNNELTNQPIFGESTTTNNLLIQYETIFNTIIEKNKNEFKIKDIYLEITKKILSGFNISVNIVILEPGSPSNCDENVYILCEMYCKDLFICENDFLYIACDQAIFRKLISYKEKHPDIQLILEQ